LQLCQLRAVLTYNRLHISADSIARIIKKDSSRCVCYNNPMNNITCDLHLHSNYSDGEKDPLDLIQIAKLAKLKIFSITDHNAISNRVEEVKNESEKQGIKFIEGIEISSIGVFK
jgi:DNA polymerase III alpha subunit (gram-positive type)